MNDIQTLVDDYTFDLYTTEHQLFRDSLRKFLDREAAPHFERWEKEGFIPKDFWKKLGKNGFLCSWVPEEYGGLGTDFGFAVILSEELERIGAGLSSISLHSDIVAPYIGTFASKEQKEKYLPDLISGEKILAIGMTEPGTGSDLANIKTSAVDKGDYYVVNGSKTFITNGCQADVYIIVCKTDTTITPQHKGISLLLVDKDTPGFSLGRKLEKLGQRSADTAELFFDNAIVSKENLIGEEGEGFTYLMEKLQQERLLVSNCAQVAAEEMLDATIQYIKEREAFGKKLSKFQNTQFKIAEMATQVKIGRTFLNDLVIKHMNGKNIVTEVSMAKYWLSDMAKHVGAECLQLHGGYGYMEEYEIARRYRDILVSSIYAGTNEIMKVIISKNLGI